MMFNKEFLEQNNKFFKEFRAKRKKYLTFGIASILIFLTILYLGPLNGLENLGLFGKKKQEQSARAEAVRGVEGDGWADIVIGKDHFTDISPNTINGRNLFNRHGVIIDRTITAAAPFQKIYVWDSGNNRILGWNWDEVLASRPVSIDPNLITANAQIVIGQPDFSSGGCNHDSSLEKAQFPQRAPAGANTLCGLRPWGITPAEGGSASSMALDSQGNLYVYDTENYRVLKFNKPFETDQIADDVWGQDNFTANKPNKIGDIATPNRSFISSGEPYPSSSSLQYCWAQQNNLTAGVDIDAAGNLWVADNCNNRVLRFPPGQAPGQHTADLVLGQTGFTTKNYGSAVNQFTSPTAVRVESQNGQPYRVYVADAHNNRILRFTALTAPSAPFTSGMNGEVFGSGFIRPNGLDFDPTEPGRIWVADKGSNTLQLWDTTTGTKVRELGKREDPNVLGEVTGSVGIDSSGNVVVTAGTIAPHGAVMYTKSTVSKLNPDKQVFSTYNEDSPIGNKVTRAGLGPQVTGVDVSNGQLIVAGSGRILYWNMSNGLSDLTNGKSSDGCIPPPGRNVSFCDNKLQLGFQPTIKADRANHLWVYQAIIYVYNLPFSGDGAVPYKQLGPTFNVIGGGVITLGSFSWGIAPAADGSFVWISDSNNNRVLRVKDPLTNPVVDVVLGQNSISGVQPNQGRGNECDPGSQTSVCTADSLYLPGSLALDREGNLYVSDHTLENQGNRRLLMFRREVVTPGSGEIIYARPASKIFPLTSDCPRDGAGKIVSCSVASWQPAFDSNNRMFLGFNSYSAGYIGSPNHRYIAYFNNPLDPATSKPDGYLNDFFSHPFSLAFDTNNNLYAADLNRNRVLIYKSPYNALLGSPSPAVSSPSPSLSPSPSASPTPSPSPVSNDTQVPSVAISEPANGVNVSGTVRILAAASDNVQVVKMQIFVDGAVVASADNSTTIFYSWNTRPKKIALGSHSIRVTASDAAGNSSSATVTVNKVR